MEKYFDTLHQARDWLDIAKYEYSHNRVLAPFYMVADDIVQNDARLPAFSEMTVNEWYDFWMKNIIPDLAWNTRRNYRERYEFNVKPVIGDLKITEVRPLHCKKVLLDMEEDYAGSTIRQTYIQMGTMFKAALINGVISKHPMDGVKTTKAVRSKSDINYLTIREKGKFIEIAKRSRNYDQYVLLLETGIRPSELIGLTWDDIDYDNRTLSVNKHLEYRYSRKTWEVGSPKTLAGYRVIPLTECAYGILRKLYNALKNRYESPDLDQLLFLRIEETERFAILI